MIKKLVLLPGMDGTGVLFSPFVNALGARFETEVVSYPPDLCLSYSELTAFVRAAVPTAEPYVLVAESFSTPIAVQFAAGNPLNLKGVVLCAGFVTNPASGWRRLVASFLPSISFRVPLPAIACKILLVGPNPSASLLTAVRKATSSVEPRVLHSRLREVLSSDARTELVRINVPLMYIQGEQDRLILASSMEEIRQLTSVEVSTIAGPHLILQREPEKTGDAIAAFVEKIGLVPNPVS